jgi:hypothetical protein
MGIGRIVKRNQAKKVFHVGSKKRLIRKIKKAQAKKR